MAELKTWSLRPCRALSCEVRDFDRMKIGYSRCGTLGLEKMTEIWAADILPAGTSIRAYLIKTSAEEPRPEDPSLEVSPSRG